MGKREPSAKTLAEMEAGRNALAHQSDTGNAAKYEHDWRFLLAPIQPPPVVICRVEYHHTDGDSRSWGVHTTVDHEGRRLVDHTDKPGEFPSEYLRTLIALLAP